MIYKYKKLEQAKLSVLERIRASIERDQMLPAAATVVVAVSGGPDSLCLLHGLHTINTSSSSPGWRLHVAHLNHQLRGEEADEDARFVQETAHLWGLPCTSERADVRTYQRSHKVSLETAARAVRYSFLTSLAMQIGAEVVALGHTSDDQVETLVQHWLRGSALAGSGGMQPRNGPFVRPLLEASHAEVLAYCAEQGLHPREDSSNADLTLQRNRIRHELLPELERYNPNLRATLLRNAALLGQDYEYIQSQIAPLASRLIQSSPSSREPHATLVLNVYRAQPAAVRAHLLRHLVAQVCQGELPLSAAHILAMDRLLTSGRSGGSLHLPAGLRLSCEYQQAHLIQLASPRNPTLPDRACCLKEPVRVEIPGVTPLPGVGKWLQARLLPAAGIVSVGLSPEQALLDAAVASSALTIRHPKPGDRFQPLGMTGSKKLQDFFTDEKVPRAVRASVLLICNSQQICWIAGYRLDDRIRVRSTTSLILMLTLYDEEDKKRREQYADEHV